MINLVVDVDSPVPAGWQLTRQFRAAVLSGRLAPGARLPRVRDVALAVGVAVGTVGRAYQQLATEGLVVCRRGVGTFVLQRPAAWVGGPVAVVSLTVEQLVLLARGERVTVSADGGAALTVVVRCATNAAGGG